MFFRLEISCVFAVSPRYRDLGPNPTSELELCQQAEVRSGGRGTYGVCRLEVSFVICDKSVTGSSTETESTYDIDALVSSNTNLGALRTEIYANDTHVCSRGKVESS